LLGLAVIAVLIGLVVVTTGAEQSPAAAPPVVTSTPDSKPSTIPYPPPVALPPAEEPVVSPPSPPVTAENAPNNDKTNSRGEVRIYNNSTIRGLAARAADDFSAAGWTVVEVGNYAGGTIPTTTAYYQEGTGQRDGAEAIGSEFGMRVEPRFPGIANASPGLIVIVTNDYVSP
jgi:hypothetical protein